MAITASAVSYVLEELFSSSGVSPKGSNHGAGHRLAAGLLHTSHGHAHVPATYMYIKMHSFPSTFISMATIDGVVVTVCMSETLKHSHLKNNKVCWTSLNRMGPALCYVGGVRHQEFVSLYWHYF